MQIDSTSGFFPLREAGAHRGLLAEMLPRTEDRAMPLDRETMLAVDDSARHGLNRVRAAAEGFEALFYAKMLAEMRKSVSDEGLFGDGAGKEVYEGLFDDLMSREMARSGHLGIADLFEEAVRRTAPVPENETAGKPDQVKDGGSDNHVSKPAQGPENGVRR